MKKIIIPIIMLFLAACATPSPEADSAEGTAALTVVATTNIVGDIVGQVGGENIQLSILLPPGADPHSFEPTPQDVAKVADADLVFANGAGLEAFLDDLIESAGASERVVPVSAGITLLEKPVKPGTNADEHEHEGEGEDEDEHADDHAGGDPHLWTDPNNVMVWTENIVNALSQADPANAGQYTANAAAYQAELTELDAWIREQVAQISVENRAIVTDHTLLGYYVEEYGLTQVGAIVPGYSSMAEPSAQELSQIEDAIAELDIKAIFVGNTVNPALAERVADDTGVQLVFFYTGSLSDPDGEAGTYLDYMRYNTTVIVDALK